MELKNCELSDGVLGVVFKKWELLELRKIISETDILIRNSKNHKDLHEFEIGTF